MKRRKHSDNLIKLLTPIDPKIGVEVGVYSGENAHYLLEELPNLNLVLIDNYGIESRNTKGWSKNKLKNKIKQLEYLKKEVEYHFLLNFQYRTKCLFISSVEASKQITNESLDFVFIDADHSYKGVKEDIKIWFPKVRKGGLVAGHDYCDKWPGVKKAVNEIFNNTVEVSKTSSYIWWIWKMQIKKILL